MNFLHSDLGVLRGGEVVEIALDKAANVKLMDGGNFGSYRKGGGHEYFGGHVTRSPLRLSVPHTGHWHVAIDLGGHAGRLRAEVRVLN